MQFSREKFRFAFLCGLIEFGKMRDLRTNFVPFMETNRALGMNRFWHLLNRTA